jgi:YHS domain-containing protein
VSGQNPEGYLERVDPGSVWRIGYAPEPWAWTDWAYSRDGRFDGRWDAPAGEYRTVYAGSSYFACLVEVLARFRPDPELVAVKNEIVVDELDALMYPTVEAGTVDRAWFAVRRVTTAQLAGSYCDVSESSTIAALRRSFAKTAIGEFRLADFDASALLNSGPRDLTQRVGRFIYELSRNGEAPFDGVRFLSRHGADLELWAIFERSNDEFRSRHLSAISVTDIDPIDPTVVQALALHSLTVG